MYEASGYGIQRNISAVLAAAIVAASGLVFDRAHLASAPEGVVEIGQLSPVEVLPQFAALPEIVVTAKRA
jgi:hypothetical protein